MKDTVKLAARGDEGLGFTISSALKKALNTKIGDTLQIEIFKITRSSGETEFPNDLVFLKEISKTGKKSQGITVKIDIVRAYNLEKNDMIGVDIKVVNKAV